jgi:hypothetical protein
LPGFYVQGLSFLARAIILKPTPLTLGRLKTLMSIIAGLIKKILMRVLPINNKRLGLAKFNLIYRFKLFGSSPSASGPGSDLEQTRELVKFLPKIITDLQIKSLVDIPCGDFFWMSKVDLTNVSYVGFDIVQPLIKANQKQYPQINFNRLDIRKESFKRHDLILCRDLLVHLTYEEIFAVLKNFKSSGSRYLLTTTFPLLSQNQDLAQRIWRPLNLSIGPFNLGVPSQIFSEDTTEDSRYSDKSLGLWIISEITCDF